MRKTLLTTTGLLAGLAAFLRRQPAGRPHADQRARSTSPRTTCTRVSDGARARHGRAERAGRRCGSTTPSRWPTTSRNIRAYAQRVRGLLRGVRGQLGRQGDARGHRPRALLGHRGRGRRGRHRRAQRVNEAGDLLYFGLQATGSTDQHEEIAFLDPRREESLEYDVTRIISRLGHPDRKVLAVVSALPLAGRQAMPWQGGGGRGVLLSLRRDAAGVRRAPRAAGRHRAAQGHRAAARRAPQGHLGRAALRHRPVRAEGRARAGLRGPVLRDGPPALGPERPDVAVHGRAREQPGQDLRRLGPGREDGHLRRRPRQRAVAARGRAQAAHRVRLVRAARAGRTSTPRTSSPPACSPSCSARPASCRSRTAPRSSWTRWSRPRPTRRSCRPARSSSCPTPPRSWPSSCPPGSRSRSRRACTARSRPASPTGRPAPDKKQPGEDADAPPAATPDPDFVAESKEPINVVVVADADLLHDQFWVQKQHLFGNTGPAVAVVHHGNGDFVMAALDNLAGSNDLISVRSRGRPSIGPSSASRRSAGTPSRSSPPTSRRCRRSCTTWSRSSATWRAPSRAATS